MCAREKAAASPRVDGDDLALLDELRQLDRLDGPLGAREVRLEHGEQLAAAERALLAHHRATLHEHDEGRDLLDLEQRREAPRLVDIDAHDLRLALDLARDRLHLRRDDARGLAIGRELSEHWELALDDLTLEGLLRHVRDRHARGLT
jgi:hypothetical protein